VGIVKLASLAPGIGVPPVLLLVVLEYHWKVGAPVGLTEAATVRLPLMLPTITGVFAAGWVVIATVGTRIIVPLLAAVGQPSMEVLARPIVAKSPTVERVVVGILRFTWTSTSV